MRFEGVHFLIADKDRVMGDFIKKSLMARFNKAVVVYFDNWEEVLDYLQRAEPNLFIIEESMPGQEGKKLLEMLQSNTDQPKLKTLLMTDTPVKKTGSLSRGVIQIEGTIVRPFTRLQLIECIEKIFRRSADSQ